MEFNGRTRSIRIFDEKGMNILMWKRRKTKLGKKKKKKKGDMKKMSSKIELMHNTTVVISLF